MRTFFVTGASRGLGRAIAEAALAAGDRVALAVRDVGAVADLVSERAAAFPLDVTDAVAAERAVAAAVDWAGPPDVVVTNAGYSDIVSIEDADIDALRAMVETNLWGVVHVVKAALPVLREAGRGHFVHISSVSGRLAPRPGLGGYVTAKFAAEGFLEAVALETGGFGLRVTMIEPGRMATGLASSMAIPEASAPYAEMVRPLAEAYAGGAVAGTDPGEAARFVLAVADLADPPLRLPMGAAAFEHIEAAERRRLAELTEWAARSRTLT